MATLPENPESPVWAREDAFPDAPTGWGWIDAKKKSHPCDSLESLTTAIRDDRDGSVTLVWAPGHYKMIVPEELEGMGDALRTARARWTRDDLESGEHKLLWFGTVLAGLGAYTFYTGYVSTTQAPDFFRRLQFAPNGLP